MLAEISSALKPHVRRILDGDFLNMPLLHKQDVERVIFYCVGILSQRTNRQEQGLVDLVERLEALEGAMDDLKKTPQPKGKKWK